VISTTALRQTDPPTNEPWREQLRTAFGDLVPEPLESGTPDGEMAGTSLGMLAAYEVSGTPQTVRRTPGAVRRTPTDLLKICVQLRGRATVIQDGREITLEPGEMAIYDTGRPYHLCLERQWACAVLVFPRDALSLPERLVNASMNRAYQLTGGPGAVLAGFVASAVLPHTTIRDTAANRLGEAGLHLIAGTLGDAALPDTEAAADALRLQILTYIRAHLTEVELTHAQVASAHHMAARTLHRLFEHEPHTVTDYIRTRRLESALRDLSDPLLTHRSIAAIAAHWCFTDQAHFTRAFHARYGMNPSAARRNATTVQA